MLGIILGISAGVANYLGIVLQKKAVNDMSDEAKENMFFKTLVKNPVWLLGLILSQAVSAVCMITAQIYVGPALLPGLMASGLIVLAIGSAKINKETLQLPEISAILFIFGAVILLGLSGLSIEVGNFDFSQVWFFINCIVFTGVFIVLSFIFEIFQRKMENVRAILLILIVGAMYVLSNFWISPLIGTIDNIFTGSAIWVEWILFLLACVILVLTNILAIGKQQTAFKYGDASKLVPLRQFPIQMAPAFIYLFVFSSAPPFLFSIPFLLVAATMIIVSSFLLGKRQAEI